MPGGVAAERDAEDDVLRDGHGGCGEGIGRDVVEEEGGVHRRPVWSVTVIMDTAKETRRTDGSTRTCPGHA